MAAMGSTTHMRIDKQVLAQLKRIAGDRNMSLAELVTSLAANHAGPALKLLAVKRKADELAVLLDRRYDELVDAWSEAYGGRNPAKAVEELVAALDTFTGEWPFELGQDEQDEDEEDDELEDDEDDDGEDE